MKKNKTISLDEDIIKKLSTEDNASGLIEELLTKHYDLAVLNAHKPDLTALQAKAEELHLQLEEIDKKKEEALTWDEKRKMLDKLGVVNQFLIDRLKNIKDKEGTSWITWKHLKDEYKIPEVLSLLKAWDILHEGEEDDKRQ